MDWFGFDVPLYDAIDPEVVSQAVGPPTAWLALLPAFLIIAVIAAVVLHRRRQRAFSCALVGREVVVDFRRGRVRACTAFEKPTAIACDRRCVDAGFRRRWPTALPVFTGRPTRREAA
ncbi:MAG TPA: hypothetical protein VGT02_06220 [Methylomirabilota bacterium]|nr:hypothetical protein [Methylomirabilota bacterium]